MWRGKIGACIYFFPTKGYCFNLEYEELFEVHHFTHGENLKIGPDILGAWSDTEEDS